MTLEDLIKRFRTMSNDKVEPYFWSDEEVTAWLNEGLREAAVRGRLVTKSNDDTVCKIELEANTSRYKLDPSVYEIRAAILDDEQLTLNTIEYLDANVSNWRTNKGKPEFVIQDETHIRVTPTPTKAGELWLDVYCLPDEMENDDDKPEIHEFSHIHLIDWALYRAFSIPDTEAFDEKRSLESLAAFEIYFGIETDADLRRATRSDLPQVVNGFWV